MKEAMSISVHVLFQQKPSPHFLVEWEKASLSWLTFEQAGAALFAHHAQSGYGTYLEVLSHFQKPVWKLTVAQAITWLCSSGEHNERRTLWELQLSDEALAWQKTARRLREVIRSGWYKPIRTDGEKGNKETSWKLWEEKEDVARWLASNDVRIEGKIRLNEMLNGFLYEMMSTPGTAVQAAWKHVVKTHPAADELNPVKQRRPRNRELLSSGSEEDWLERIGFENGDVPFRIGVRVEEAYDDGAWRMTPVLVDQDTAGNHYIFPSTPEGNHPPEKTANEDMFPPSWLELSRQSVPRMVAKWKERFADFTWQPDSTRLWRFLEQEAPQLENDGHPVFLPKWWQRAKQVQPKLIAHVYSKAPGILGMDALLSYDWKVSLGDQQFSEEDFQEMLRNPDKMIRVDGEWVPLHPTWLKRIEQVIKQQKDGMRMAEVLSSHWSQESLEDEEPIEDSQGSSIAVQIRLNEVMERMIYDLEQSKEKARTELHLTPRLSETLRPYQKEGAAWLASLRNWGFGACLADDMGLGKTLQCIAYITHLKLSGISQNPVLLICPTSVLGNWQKELQRFAPELKVHLHYGSRRALGVNLLQETQQVDIVLTSYVLANLDRNTLQQTSWEAVVLDEAHHIKNPYSKQSIAVRKLDAAHRIAMTGTPVENRLAELWSIFDFINPGYLGRLRRFQEQYIHPIEQKKDPHKTASLQRMVQPFLLRRTKQDRSISLNLPKLQENKTYVPLTPEQAVLYEQVLERMMQQIQPSAHIKRKGIILSSMQHLKRICDHPALYLREPSGSHAVEQWMARSHKAERLVELVEEILIKQEKCLIFTQYVEMGRMISDALSRLGGMNVPFMYGATPKEERDRLIAQFQEEDIQSSEGHGVFVLSLKTGGTGLNLTAANHVLHYDRWWNPAVENQATDRVYRIGQTRDVQVHKFIALGTLEERIDEMLSNKLELSQSVIGTGEKWITEFSDEDLKDLFSLQREWV